ncbi:alpha/beta hydrolase [Aureimonas sp. D3]|uniref:alpha/beta hydrolase n=1 Tax=Aureimonas sp. D3 TaxID=1638164 RepID=UPI000784449C|nr:alpha/beta hydrolase [Aureimonas sp. D3]
MDLPRNDLSMIHRFIPATVEGATPLLLLHGTGGDESDLLGLGGLLSPGAALLSPRGQVLENGMPRFFRRLAEGVFDEADLRQRALELGAFVEEARERHGMARPVAVGFSNGANVASALMMLDQTRLAGAILIRAMVPFAEPPAFDLGGAPVLLLSGGMDPIVPADNAARLARQLQEGGARLTHEVLPTGHGLGQMDLVIAREWLAASFA